MFLFRKYLYDLSNVFKHPKHSITHRQINNYDLRKVRNFNTAKRLREKNEDESGKENQIAGSLLTKYDVFKSETVEIFDVEQEREKFYEINDETESREKSRKTMTGIDPKRGNTGVIELKELIDLLRRENATDIVVIKIPEVVCYADYMVITSAKSSKHMYAVAEFVRSIFKYKMNDMDILPQLEGKACDKWKALDLQNIILHIFSKSTRDQFDIETLWSVGKTYDSLYNEKKSKEMNYASLLSDLKPVDAT